MPVVVRAGDRFVTSTDGIESRHCFSFGAHYDPANTHFGPLLACNDETLSAGSGFAMHPHAGVEIVTWIVEGLLEHADSTGGRSLAEPGVVHVLRTGTGADHSERNPGPGQLRFVQLWLAGADPEGAPAFERRDVRDDLASGALVPIAFGGEGVSVYAGRLSPGAAAAVPPAALHHIYVVRGEVALDAVGVLAEGDSARLTAVGEAVAGDHGAEVLVWSMTLQTS
jgi:redox-sensitive bicupin YhaK (pirin superfamily)